MRIEVAAGLVFHGRKLLLTQRRPQDHLGGLWEFPGGKREPGETFEACLARELDEELGIQVEVGRLIETISHDYPDKRVLLKFFKCRWSGAEPQLIGCHAMAWVSQDELDRYEFPDADARLIARLKAEPRLWE